MLPYPFPVTRPLVFMPAARVEVIEAQDWYNKQASGLGARFVEELDHQAGRISANPLQFSIMLAEVETGAITTFPVRTVFSHARRHDLCAGLFPRQPRAADLATSYQIVSPLRSSQ